MGRSRTGAVLGVVGTATLLACNGILGLDEFSSVQCTGGRCDGGVVDGSTDAADATVDALGTAPVSWAQWKMPNYPQAVDGGVENVASYTPTSDNGVLDDVSRLVWQANATRGALSYADAQTSCPSGWRLPSRIELVTLLDLSATPKIDTRTFPGTESTAYWTSSAVRPYTAATRKRWVVDFGSGSVRQVEETGSASVRCIKSTP